MANKLMQFFKFEHLPEHLKVPSAKCFELACHMDATLPESAEKTTGLRKLLEAKDCFVRAVLESTKESKEETVQEAAERGFNS